MIPSLESSRELRGSRRSDIVAIHFQVGPGVPPAHPVLASPRGDGSSCLPYFVFASLWTQVVLGFRSLLFHTNLASRYAGEGDLGNGLIMFPTSDRARATALALEFMCIPREAMEIAWFHGAENAWVTLHPDSAALPFDRHLTEEQYRIRSERSASHLGFYSAPPSDSPTQ